MARTDDEALELEGLRGLAAVVLPFDCAALAILALVPLAGPLGLADLEIPASAVLGWLLFAVPLLLAGTAALGIVARRPRLTPELLLRSAFCVCLMAWLLSVSMLLGRGQLPPGADRLQFRGFALIAFALFSMNLLLLYRPALSQSVASRERHAKPKGRLHPR
jgi:hypothetical protein